MRSSRCFMYFTIGGGNSPLPSSFAVSRCSRHVARMKRYQLSMPI